MNEEEFQNIIKTSVEDEKLQHYLLNCLHCEYKLNALSAKFLVDKASERFKNKIKTVQQIEKDLPDNLISLSDSYLLLTKLKSLRYNLVILYANALGNRITEEKQKEYNEIKEFVFKLLSLNIKLKLKYFELAIILLNKLITDSNANKTLIRLFDLLKLFINEPGVHPNKEDLRCVTEFMREIDENDAKEIRKNFFGIIRELNKKLLFQTLFNQLLEILKQQIDSPLIHFITLFTNKCINDSNLDVDDMNQIINLVYHALEAYNNQAITSKKIVFNTLFTSKTLSDYLIEFQKDFKEKIFQSMESTLINTTHQEKPYFIDNILQDDFKCYFPKFIDNERILTKLYEANHDYIKEKESQKNVIQTGNNDLNFYFKSLTKKTSKINLIKSTAKLLSSHIEKKLNEFTEINSAQLIQKNFKSPPKNENKKVIENDLKHLLMPAKKELLTIRNELEKWNSFFQKNTIHDDSFDSPPLQLPNQQIDLNHVVHLIKKFNRSINDRFNVLIQQLSAELERMQHAIEKKKPWFIARIEKSTLFYKLIYCGCLSFDFTLKKIQAQLESTTSFNVIKNFILNHNFLELLSYGIIRWPWLDKVNVANTWAEQCALYGDNRLIEDAKRYLNINSDKEKMLNQIIMTSDKFYLQNKINEILKCFKYDLNRNVHQLKILEDQMAYYLNKEPGSISVNRTDFFEINRSCGSENKINNRQGVISRR